jgi:hypothetical protein
LVVIHYFGFKENEESTAVRSAVLDSRCILQGKEEQHQQGINIISNYSICV